jgi:hypothetical protein
LSATKAAAPKLSRVIARTRIYVGGASHPFSAGEELDLPEAHVAELIQAGHVETHEGREKRLTADAAEATAKAAEQTAQVAEHTAEQSATAS